MRRSIMAMLAVATAIAGGIAPVHAQSTNGLKSLGYNWTVVVSGAQTTMNATVTIYDTSFNALTTDCLPAGVSRICTGAYPAAVGEGLYIRYQLYSAGNACAGAALLDTSYGPKLTGDLGMFQMQYVPASLASPSNSRTGPTNGGGLQKK